MATSTLMASDQSTKPSQQPLEDQDHDRAESMKRKASVPESSSAAQKKKKKTPQRGMGVEKLERLRLEERWRRMTDISNSGETHFPVPAISASFPHSFQWGRFGFGGSRTETSAPNDTNFHLHELCSYCHKKRRGFNVEESQGLGTKPPLFLQPGYAVLPTGRPVMEVEAVHKKGSLDRSVLIEYEFFPSFSSTASGSIKNDRKDSHNDKIVMIKNLPESSGNFVGGFDLAPTSSSTSIDLSLKLSV